MTTLHISIEIEELPPNALEKLFQEKSPPFGFTRKIAKGITAVNQTTGTFGIEAYSAATLLITVTTSIATSIIANAIYDWLKVLMTSQEPQNARLPEIYVQGRETDLSLDSIELALKESEESEEEHEC